MTPATDPTSLDRLFDIVTLPPVPWWPPAPGWFVVAGVVLAGGAWAAWRGWRRWHAAAYRRAALAELRRLRGRAATEYDAAVMELPALLKRTALAAFPRETVASLSGAPWLAFLDRSGGTDAFTHGSGAVLGTLAYDPRVAAGLDAAATARLFDVAQRWIAGHSAAAAAGA